MWAHVLAYNLIRTVMAQAAAREGVPPRSISFKATLQVLEAFRPLIAYQADRGAGTGRCCIEQVLRAIAVHRVADRPTGSSRARDEAEAEGIPRLTSPRREIKLQMLKRVSKI